MTTNSVSTNINSFVKRDICKQRTESLTTHNKRTILLSFFFSKQKVSLTVNSSDVIEFILGTKDVRWWRYNSWKNGFKRRAHIYYVLCNLQRPYKIQDLEPAALIDVAQYLELLMILKIIQYGLISLVSFYCDDCDNLSRCRLYQEV